MNQASKPTTGIDNLVLGVVVVVRKTRPGIPVRRGERRTLLYPRESTKITFSKLNIRDPYCTVLFERGLESNAHIEAPVSHEANANVRFYRSTHAFWPLF